MVRDRVFRFRLSEEEYKRLSQLAKDRGVDRAELIREALGLNGGEASSLPAAATGKQPDPKKEPGAAGITELAERMARKRRKKQ